VNPGRRKWKVDIRVIGTSHGVALYLSMEKIVTFLIPIKISTDYPVNTKKGEARS